MSAPTPLHIFLALILFGGAEAKAQWTIVNQQGRDYVSFENVGQFYQFREFTRGARRVALRSGPRALRAEGGTSEIFINGVRFFSEFPILSNNAGEWLSAMDVSKIVEPVLRPNRIHDAQKIQTVVLDPGHGGTDSGASGPWGSEKMFTLDVATQARAQLERSGFKVAMTRTSDSGVSLEDRVRFANQFPNAVLVSIHFNASSGGTGVESYALAPAGVASNASSENHGAAIENGRFDGNAQDEKNIALTAAIHGAVLSRLAAFDRGVRHARFHVLREAKIPAVLVEGGFLSHAVEGRRIATSQYRRELALAIAQGVQTFDAAVNFQAAGATFAAGKTNFPPHESSITEPLEPEGATVPAPPPSQQPSVSIDAGQD